MYTGQAIKRMMYGDRVIWPKTPKHIELTAEITAANQTVKVNKYFANVHNIDWGDGSPVANHTEDTTHTYTTTGTYKIKLTLAGGATRWTFGNVFNPLVPTTGTTANNIYISTMPSLANYFGANATNPGNNFFSHFNRDGALTSLPENSFDTSNITTVGDNFFRNFNYNGALTSLPESSFDTSNITTVGDYFFANFNTIGALTSLPAGSFDTSNITSVGNRFFFEFNNSGKIFKQVGGVQIKNITNGAVLFHHRNGMWGETQNVNPGDTFNGYTVG